jgi:hypothetical protein
MVAGSDFLTVGTIDYVPQTVATLRSARRHGKHTSFNLFALDATPEAVITLRRIFDASGESWINVFGPHDLESGREAFLSAFDYYDPLELSCLAKYVGLAHLLRAPNGGDVCVYADADILFLGDVSTVCGEMDPAVALLTPHQLGPTSDSTEHEYLMHGWMNAGFLCFRRDRSASPPVLDWLIHRISRRGFAAPHYGVFLDQAWISGLPFVFSSLTQVSRHPGLNVAYWNLEERHLECSAGRFLVNGLPLLCFHFSGFDRTDRRRLSKHSDVEITEGTPLDEIRRLYRAELEAAEPFRQKVASLERLPSAKDALEKRILKCSIKNHLSLSAPAAQIGFFCRLGRKLDLLLSRFAG